MANKLRNSISPRMSCSGIGLSFIGLEYRDSFALDIGLDQRMKRVVRAELHVEAKLACEHVLKLDQFHKPEFFWIEIDEYIEVTVWPFVTPCPEALDITRGRA
jgi:hypothetical protein